MYYPFIKHNRKIAKTIRYNYYYFDIKNNCVLFKYDKDFNLTERSDNELENELVKLEIYYLDKNDKILAGFIYSLDTDRPYLIRGFVETLDGRNTTTYEKNGRIRTKETDSIRVKDEDTIEEIFKSKPYYDTKGDKYNEYTRSIILNKDGFTVISKKETFKSKDRSFVRELK